MSRESPHCNPSGVRCIVGFVFNNLSTALCSVAFELKQLRLAREHDIHVVLHGMTERLDKIMATQAEAAVEVRNLTAKINKIGTETATTLQKVKDLEAIIVAGGEVSEELRTALDEAIAAATAADDLTPDATPTPA